MMVAKLEALMKDHATLGDEDMYAVLVPIVMVMTLMTAKTCNMRKL